MTAINIFLRPDAVHIFTDGAAYHGDGTVTGMLQKVVPIAHLSTVVVGRGSVIFLPYMAQVLSGIATRFDEAVEVLETVFSQTLADCASLLRMSPTCAGSEPVRCVGVFCHHTTVTPDGITSRILERWPDRVGERIVARSCPA